jgi:hypothetical protein
MTDSLVARSAPSWSFQAGRKMAIMARSFRRKSPIRRGKARKSRKPATRREDTPLEESPLLSEEIASTTPTISLFKVKRIRSRAHLKFVREHDCCSCGLGGPVHAHHIQFAQPRAKGLKSGDDFTVPLCHPCHMDLHGFGDERSWWALKGVDPMDVARNLWKESKCA